MKKFIVATIIFPLPLIIYFAANFFINQRFYKANPKLNNTRILIMGDSHSEKGLDPEIFSSAQNISQVAEPYVLTHWKLKKILETYTPDTLIVGFGPHNIAKFNDMKFSDRRWSSEMFKRSYTIEDLTEIDEAIEIDYAEFYRTIWKQMCFYPKKNHISYIGKYKNKDLNNIADSLEAIKRHFYLRGEDDFGISPTAIKSLDAVSNLCKENDIVLILMNYPVHKGYRVRVPNIVQKEFDALQKKYASQATIIDRFDANYPDDLFLNSDHLNAKGAERFTKEIITYFSNSK